jgi:hypothetical protein
MGKTQLSMLGTATKHEREGVDKGTKKKEQHKRGKHKQKTQGQGGKREKKDT